MAENKIINDFHPLVAKQKFTVPPSRFSESSITGALDKEAILRPSMAGGQITSLLASRGYITIKSGAITVTQMGIDVCDFLVSAGFDFMEVKFTADLEKDLDDISNGTKNKLGVLTDFYESLKKGIEKAKEVKKNKEVTEYKCPICQGFLLLKHSFYGKFYSCQNYKSPKKVKGEKVFPEGSCQYTANVGDDGTPVEKVKKVLKESDICCKSCGEKFIIRTSKKGNEYLACRNWNKNKDCSGFSKMDGTKMEFAKKKWHNWKKK